MGIAPPTPEANARTVANDRARMRYALLGSIALLAGMWIAWLAFWLLGWSPGELGIRPRDPAGLVGILTAPFAHADFAHLMSNTLPMGVLATLTLYSYPRAARIALPLIWLLSGLGVWLFARSAVHVGASGIAHGLMFFLFVMGLIRRDRLAIVVSLVVFFLYGGMLASILPQEERVSFEYHFAGAVAGVLAALLLHARDPLPPRKRYSWEEEAEEPAAEDELELPHASEVPVLWQHGESAPATGQVIAFRPRAAAEDHAAPDRDSAPPTG
ncbi:rhomboid family intramembrane serine protease [Dokdonella sp.]|uniref:rhomboid family intramembrane serine protease n=1 Tax=Dokdonella sp. TaxID=2291710 RepID=UPI003AF5723C